MQQLHIINRRTVLGAVMSLVLASMALAQDDSQQPAQQLPDSELKRFKDWAVECQQSEAASKTCVMFQRQVLENGRTLLTLSIRKAPDNDAPQAVLQLPLGVLLDPGVLFSVDGGEPHSFSYRLCNVNGCLVHFPLDERLRSELAKGERAEIVLTTTEQEKLNVGVSLSGFSAALSAL